MRENSSVQARFLLGPAGSGKTFRCLAEIRDALAAAPDGPLLILLAPKQATFQLERQLLADPALQGYTRLRILSFERLAEFVLTTLRVAPPQLLNEEGRVMVLRALLMRHGQELKLFRKSARRPGFARQLGEVLAELQQHQFTPAKLRGLAARPNLPDELRHKLHDLALLFDAYTRWLGEHELQDANRLLDFATGALRPQSTPHGSRFTFQRLWLDGFAEMTPAEMDLLAAVLPGGERATLAFCLDESAAPAGGEASWLSLWATLRKTYQECRRRVEALPDGEISVEQLRRGAQQNRFARNPELALLEAHWSGDSPVRASEATPDNNNSRTKPSAPQSISLIACPSPEAEAAFAAREILRSVRDGGRFRDTAVLVRDLERYHQPLERAFRRYEIPVFLDRRESVAHHPLAELTRSALRTVAFDWQPEDWFAALKTGFPGADEAEVDRLENESLAHGWRGAKWREPLSIADDPALARSAERLRQALLPPFTRLAQRLAALQNQPTGAQLAEALRELWAQLDVERTLERRSLAEAQTCETSLDPSRPGNAASCHAPLRQPPLTIHLTVWEQMNAWLDNLELAFPRGPLPLRDWLPILEAGLANLTVGVIPPALDQVLIGAIDRSRNPDLKLALVLGLNEGVFPAPPAAPNLLTDTDRDALQQHGAALGPDLRDQLARERYLGYIACTRASQKLVATYSRQDANGKLLNPSTFVSHWQRLWPGLEGEAFSGEVDLHEAEHVCELVAPLIAVQNAAERRVPTGREMGATPQGAEPVAGAPVEGWAPLLQLPALAMLRDGLRQLRHPDPAERLSPALAEKLFGPVLRTSVSRLEAFAACPFKFFVHSGLRAEERKLFELDAREQGGFQHEVLRLFHDQLRGEGKRWRDLTPAEARERVGRIAAALTADYRDGLLRDTEQSRFTARVLTESLQDFVEVLVDWMRGQYEFEPAAVELEFGGRDGKFPGWEMDLGAGHRLVLQGRIDRVDLCREPGGDAAWCVVMDYKSGHRQLDPVLMRHGVQLQLLGYLSVLRHWADPRPLFGVARLVPAGVFYVNLRGKYERAGSRAEGLADAEAARKLAYRHTGRFDASLVRKLDRRPDVTQGDQFNYRLNQDGGRRANSTEALERAQFEQLLENFEARVREMGPRIIAGDATVDPYRKSGATPCEQCDYRAICRIDPWTHRYRVLRKAEAEANED
jgi:ATP-dependent helicase/nuclease subunit B